MGPATNSLRQVTQLLWAMEHGIPQMGLSGNYKQVWSSGHTPWHIDVALEIVFLFCVTHGD